MKGLMSRDWSQTRSVIRREHEGMRTSKGQPTTGIPRSSSLFLSVYVQAQVPRTVEGSFDYFKFKEESRSNASHNICSSWDFGGRWLLEPAAKLFQIQSITSMGMSLSSWNPSPV